MITRTVNVRAVDQNGIAYENAIITAVLDKTDIDSDSGYIVPEQVTVRSDVNGDAVLSLWPNDRGSEGTRYRVLGSSKKGKLLFDLWATVPDSDGFDLTDISVSASCGDACDDVENNSGGQGGSSLSIYSKGKPLGKATGLNFAGRNVSVVKNPSSGNIDVYASSGYMAVADEAERDAILDIERVAGMLVKTIDDGKYWELGSDLLQWTEESLGGDAEITAKINVYGDDLGAYSEGDEIPAGTPMETILRNMLTQIVLPVTYPPTLTLSSSITKLTLESGQSVTPVLTPAFNKRDGGLPSEYRLYKDTIEVHNNSGAPVAVTATNFNMPDGNAVFYSEVDYSTGDMPKDNAGNDYPSAQIDGDTKRSNSITYKGVRKIFYGFVSDTLDIRSNPGKLIDNTSTMTINFTGSGGMIMVAIPTETFSYIHSASFVSGPLTFPGLENSFIEQAGTVNVLDASGGNAKPYKVFVYSPDAALTDAAFSIVIR